MQKISDTQYKSVYIYTLCTIASLGTFLSGYMLAIFAPVQDYFTAFLYPDLTSAEIGFIIACVPIGGAIGSSVAGSIASKLGRRPLILIVDLATVSASILSVVENVHVLMASRFVLGLCVGFNSVISPLYQIEIVPNPLRGIPGTFSQLFFTSGIFVVFVVGLFIPGKAGPKTELWKLLFLIPSLTSGLRLLLFLSVFRFETPKYLVLNHQEEEAEEVLGQLYQKEAITEKLEELRVERSIENTKGKKMRFSDLFKPRFRKRKIGRAHV